MLPVAAISILLAILADEERTSSRRVFQRAKDEGWLPRPGELQETALRVPRRWFHTHPELVPPPFAWPSTHNPSIVEHPYRTVHVLLNIDNFLALTSTPEWQLKYKKERMFSEYLPIAKAMVEGQLKPDFPPPWLQLRYKPGNPDPYVVGHEGRHRALLARELGLKVLPVVLVMGNTRDGEEHQRDTIDQDPFVDRLTRGLSPYIWSQNHGSDAPIQPRFMKVEPKDATGEDLLRQLIRVKYSLDPTLR